MSVEKIVIFCDGACSGNQFANNKGGWGAVLKYGEKTKTIYGGEQNTTNQRMELTACIQALEQVKDDAIDIELYSDSAYLISCMNAKWYVTWQKNGWKNSKKQPVENQDLWEKILILIKRYRISFHKVSGHSGIELNELADSLARQGINGPV